MAAGMQPFRAFAAAGLVLAVVTLWLPTSMAAAAWNDAPWDVDFVYMWVDGENSGQAALRAADYRMAAATVTNAASELFDRPGQAGMRARFRRHPRFFRSSLRAAMAFAPWVRTIHVVMSDADSLAPPLWLEALTTNTSSAVHVGGKPFSSQTGDRDDDSTAVPRVKIVPHSVIFPNKRDLPTHNSFAIECWLHRIPDLAERFVAFNDDMMIGRPVEPSLFFTPGEGLPRMWPDRVLGVVDGDHDRHEGNSYWATVAFTNQALRGVANLSTVLATDEKKKWAYFAPDHQARALTRELVASAVATFAAPVAETSRSRFRTRGNVWVLQLAMQVGLATGRAVVVPAQPGQFYFGMITGKPSNDQRVISELARRGSHDLVCVNRDAGDHATDDAVNKALADLLGDLPLDVMDLENEGEMMTSSSGEPTPPALALGQGALATKKSSSKPNELLGKAKRNPSKRTGNSNNAKVGNSNSNAAVHASGTNGGGGDRAGSDPDVAAMGTGNKNGRVVGSGKAIEGREMQAVPGSKAASKTNSASLAGSAKLEEVTTKKGAAKSDIRERKGRGRGTTRLRGEVWTPNGSAASGNKGSGKGVRAKHGDSSASHAPATNTSPMAIPSAEKVAKKASSTGRGRPRALGGVMVGIQNGTWVGIQNGTSAGNSQKAARQGADRMGETQQQDAEGHADVSPRNGGSGAVGSDGANGRNPTPPAISPLGSTARLRFADDEPTSLAEQGLRAAARGLRRARAVVMGEGQVMQPVGAPGGGSKKDGKGVGNVDVLVANRWDHHKWRTTEDCTDTEIRRNTPYMVENDLWKQGQEWMLDRASEGPGAGCVDAKLLYYELVGDQSEEDAEDHGEQHAEEWGEYHAATSASPLIHRSAGHNASAGSHWGFVYRFQDGRIRDTNLCLNVCDVGDAVTKIPAAVYKLGLAAMSVLVEPWPMDMCTWVEDSKTFAQRSFPVYEGDDALFDCQQLWRAQIDVWRSWSDKRWSPQNNCRHVTEATLRRYAELEQEKN